MQAPPAIEQNTPLSSRILLTGCVVHAVIQPNPTNLSCKARRYPAELYVSADLTLKHAPCLHELLLCGIAQQLEHAVIQPNSNFSAKTYLAGKHLTSVGVIKGEVGVVLVSETHVIAVVTEESTCSWFQPEQCCDAACCVHLLKCEVPLCSCGATT